MLQIKDIMTTKVHTVEADAPAEEAAWGFTFRHISGAPARDAEGNLVGVLSSSDLMNPEPKQWIKGEATVADLMNPDVVSLYAKNPTMSTVKEMATRHIHQIVVLDSNSKLARIVTPINVMLALARGVSFDTTN